MNFTPKTEQQIAESGLLKPGIYPFEIVEADETTSKARGNDMIRLRVRIGENGSTRMLTDYLLPQRPEKLRHCCLACGCHDSYESGALTSEDFLGKTGRLKIAIEKGQKHEGGRWPDRNVIADYLAA